MNDHALDNAERPNWPARILGLFQHLVELTVLGEVLIALGMISHPFSLEGMSWFSGMVVNPILLVVGILLVIPLAWLACRNFWNKLAAGARQDSPRLPMPATALALPVLVALGLCLIMLWSPTFLHAKPGSVASPSWEPGAWLSLMLLVILARYCRRPLDFYLAALGIFTLVYGGFYWHYIMPKMLYIRHNFNIGVPYPGQAPRLPGFMVSTLFMPLRTVLGVLLPFLAALYGIRRGFAWWKFLAAGLAGWLVTDSILFLHWPDLGSRLTWIGLVLTAAFLFLMARLPGQRWGLERLTGLAFATRPDVAPAPRGGLATSLLAHALLALLIGLLAGFSVVGFYEGKMLRDSAAGPAIQPCSPALVNAYNILKPVYQKMSPENTPKPARIIDELELIRNLGPMSRATMEEVKGLIDPALIEKEIQALSPRLDLLVQAGGADCYRRLELNKFAGFAQFCRNLMARTSWRVIQGRKAEALADIEALFKLAWMMNDDPNATVLQHLIAAVMRGVALDTAQNYYLYFRQDPAALDELKAMLNRNARMVRVEWPAESVARTEHAFGPVVPYFEMIVPMMGGRAQEFYRTWPHYDYLVLAVALEAYRHDHGAYPARLAELAPRYLERLPREPFQGQDYQYENLGQDFRLSNPLLDNPADRNPGRHGVTPWPRSPRRFASCWPSPPSRELPRRTI